jgi:recombination protein RecT
VAATNLIQRSTAAQAMKPQDEKSALQVYIRQMQGEIRKALPSVMTPERFTRIILSALSGNPKLAQTTPQSFLGAMMTAAQLGVEPNTPLGQAYLIPFYNSRTRSSECQFQLGYKGLIDLAYRSGEISTIQAHVVYENDVFEYSFGLDPTLRHVPAHADRGEPVFVYAVFRTKDGGFGFEVMSMEDVRAFAQQYSKAFGSGPWQTNFEEMAKKTVLKRALKYAPVKSDFLRGVAQDNTVKTEISEDMYAVPGTVIEVNSETGEFMQYPAAEEGEDP